MISIVICSRQKKINLKLKKSIENFIGVFFEYIIIDNSKNKLNISQAYNLGLKQAKFEYILFIHDDVEIVSNDFGVKIIDIFNSDLKIGLIGVAGAKYKSKSPSTWSETTNNAKVINIIQSSLNHDKRYFQGFNNKNNEDVVCVDGVFIALRKSSNIIFNERIDGFHQYDLAVSMECIKARFKIVVTRDILIKHFSYGTINKEWYITADKFYREYKQLLPIGIAEFSKNKSIDSSNYFEFCDKLLDNKMHKMFLYYFKEFLFNQGFKKSQIYLIRKYLFC